MHLNKYKSSLMTLAVVSALGVTDFTQAQMLEEVVVTARKRSESMQDVPMAVSAFSADQLQAAQVDDILDLQRMTPNVTMTTTGGLIAGAVAIFMRGIGNDQGFDQGVGVYLDDVYINRTTGALLDVFDTERVEVLKGPQGHLYGRNTIGGAVKFISKEPTEEFTGHVEASVGEFDMVKVKANVAGPIIGDTLLGSFGAMYKNRDGIQTNTFDGGEYWSEDLQGYRGTLVWNATDNLRVKLSADYTKDESDPSVPNRVGLDLTSGLFGAGADFVLTGGNTYLGPGIGLVDGPQDVSLPTDIDRVSTEYVDGFSQYQIEATTFAATIEWALNDQWTLKSVTAQRSVDNTQPFDFDGSEQQFITTIRDIESDDFSQELQLNFSSDSLQAVAGLYYLDGEQDAPQQTQQYFRLLITEDNFKDTYKAHNEVESTSAYFNVDWNFTEQWQASIGGRYTEDKKDESQQATVTRGFPAFAGLQGFPPEAVGFVRPGQESAAEQSPLFAYWASAYTPLGNSTYQQVSFPEPTQASEKWTEFSPSAKLTWFASDDAMIYASYASGFKSGGFQRNSGVSTTYDPETVDTYSLGMKSTWLDGSMRINGEVFFNDYQDKQLATVVLEGTDLIERVGNVGELETSGVEVEVLWLPPVDGLTVGFNAGYLDTKVKSYESADGDKANSTAIGFSPEWTAQGRVSYDFDVADWGTATIGTDFSYRDDSYTNSPIDLNSFSADLQVQDSHVIWNAILAFRTRDEHWRVAIEGKNLDDERVLVNSYVIGPIVTGAYNMPRTWAVSVGYDF